jgi:hypothetical protein
MTEAGAAYCSGAVSGFVRELYKVIKEGTARGVVGRIFMTGVSPVTLDDLTSGFNITSNVSLDVDLNALCGFTSADVDRIVAGVLGRGDYTLDPAAVSADLRRYYNGYLFSPRGAERIFNPDMVLFFAKGMAPPAWYPAEVAPRPRARGRDGHAGVGHGAKYVIRIAKRGLGNQNTMPAEICGMKSTNPP